MSDNTLGPWTRTHPEFYPLAESRWQIRGPDGELIARIEKRPKGSKCRGDANGDLLAAAPELLAACVVVRTLVDIHVQDGNGKNYMAKLLDAVIGKALGNV